MRSLWGQSTKESHSLQTHNSFKGVRECWRWSEKKQNFNNFFLFVFTLILNFLRPVETVHVCMCASCARPTMVEAGLEPKPAAGNSIQGSHMGVRNPTREVSLPFLGYAMPGCCSQEPGLSPVFDVKPGHLSGHPNCQGQCSPFSLTFLFSSQFSANFVKLCVSAPNKHHGPWNAKDTCVNFWWQCF